MNPELTLYCLFPGPLKVLCEDQDIKCTQDLKNVLQEIGRKPIVDSLLAWFHTWKTSGKILPCTLTESDQRWVGCDLFSCKSAEDIFDMCVDHNLWDLLDWCYQVQPRCFRLDVTDYFSEKGNLKVLQWLYQTGNLRVQDCLYTSCRKGFFAVVQWLHEIGVDIHKEEDRAFRFSCIYGHLSVAQWLYRLDPENVNPDDYVTRLISLSCIYGHLSVAQWLYSLSGHKIDLYDAARTFRQSCEKGHLHIAQWLYQLGHHYILLSDFLYAFYQSCQCGHLPVAQWLYHTRRDLSADYTYAFRLSCHHGHLPVAQWLYHVFGNKINFGIFDVQYKIHHIHHNIHHMFSSG